MEYLHDAGGKHNWLLATVSYIQTTEAGRHRYSYVVVDVTDRKEAEERLREAYEHLEGVARLRTSILTNITHEVRTPLTVILGFTSMLRKGVEPRYRRFVDLMERSGRRLMLMLDTVLDLAQLEAGTLRLEAEPFDVVELVHNEIERFHSYVQEKGLNLHVEEQPTSRPLLAYVDQNIFGRVLGTVMDNAIKFTEEGGIFVSFEAAPDHVHVQVRDTGIGISADFLPHLFDEFAQESTGLERTHQGSGLGLTVARRLLEAAGGSIHVDSEKGTGSRFTLVVPRYYPAT